MKALFAVLVLALGATLSTMFVHPSFAYADSAYTLSSFTPVVMTEIAAPDQTSQQPVVKTSWGAIKALYRSDAPSAVTNPASIKKQGVGPMNSVDQKAGLFPGGDWSSRVAWEARKALDPRADGTSNYRISGDAYYGDYDYARTDMTAYHNVMLESGYQYGNTTPGTVYPYNGLILWHEGTCTWFVREVLYRASYWAGYGWHLTTPGYPGSVYTKVSGMTQYYPTARPGWILVSFGKHMAIADQRTTVNTKVGWWVIDSNYVGPGGTEVIGRHFMSDEVLGAGGYWAWCPTWATTN